MTFTPVDFRKAGQPMAKERSSDELALAVFVFTVIVVGIFVAVVFFLIL